MHKKSIIIEDRLKRGLSNLCDSLIYDITYSKIIWFV